MPIKLNSDGTFPMYIDPVDGRRKPTAETDAVTTSSGSGGPHTHPETDVTNLTADLAAKAASTHNHDSSYSGTGHTHSYEPSGAVATHAAAADPHPVYLTSAEGNAAYSATGHTHAYAATSHSHVIADTTSLQTTLDAKALGSHNHDVAYAAAGHTHAGGSTIPSGVIVMWGGPLANIPSGWVLCDGLNGTPDLRDRFIRGAANGADPGTTGGSGSHAHADHAALTHSGTAVADHTFTQPTAAGEAAHTHTYTQTVNHVHVENLQGGTTGTTTGTHLMGSAATGGSLRAAGQSTANPTGGVATGTTAAGSSHTHTMTGGAVSAHGVTQPSQHAAQSHDTVAHLPTYYALAFIQKV